MANAKETPAEAGEAATAPTVDVVVAPGRSIVREVPGSARYASYAHGNGVTEQRLVTIDHVRFMPGQTVKVDAKELPFLLRTGSIVSPIEE